MPRLRGGPGRARLRLRPILMTSFAFILGVVPLVLASGAGAEMRRALGLAVFSGMLGVTFFGIFLTPVFFYLLAAIVIGRKARCNRRGNVWRPRHPGMKGRFCQPRPKAWGRRRSETGRNNVSLK